MLGLGTSISTSSSPESKYSLDLDGTGDYLDLGHHFNTTFDGSFTVSFWAKPDDGQPADLQYFFGTNTSSSGDSIYGILKANGTFRLTMIGSGSGGSDTGYFNTDNAVFDDGVATSWVHILVAVTLPGSGNSSAVIYINGDLVDHTTSNIAYDDHAAFDGTSSLFIGARSVDGAIGTKAYIGNIDEFAIWSTNLNEDGIQAIYNNGVPFNLNNTVGSYDNQPQLVGYWRMGDGLFDDKANGIVHDQDNPGFENEFIEGDDADFDTVGNWTGSGATVTGGYDSSDDGHATTLRIQANGTTNSRAELPQSAFRGSEATVADKVYLVTFDFKWIEKTDVINNPYVTIGGTSLATIDRTATGWTEYSRYFRATDNSTNIRVYVNGDSGHADNEILIDNFSIKELKGNPGITSGNPTFSSDAP